jgi:hypothetical protein
MKRWLHGAWLGVSLTLAPQSPTTLVDLVDEHPDFVIASEPETREDIEALFGEDLEAALDFGLVQVIETRVGSGAGETALRLTEMTDSAAAFGLFALGRDWRAPDYEPVVLGTEGYARGDRIVFWQGPYVVRLEGPMEACLALGRALANAITLPSRKPPVSTLLPARGRMADSEQYILTPAVLAGRTGIEPDLLGFESNVEVALASYEDGGETATLALFYYPTPQLARLHAEAWESGSGGAMSARLSGLMFGIVPSTTSPHLADALLGELRSELEITWSLPPPDPVTIQQIVLTAFTWIGIALLFTVVIGMGFGGLRIFLKTRFPHSPFVGGSSNELVQLHIDQPVKRH